MNGGAGKGKPDCSYPGSKGPFCLWANDRTGYTCSPLPVVGGVWVGLHADPPRLSSYRVELELKVRLSASPANHQHHVFPVMSLQMWARSLGASLPLAGPPPAPMELPVLRQMTAPISTPRRDKTCWVSYNDWFKIPQFKVHRQKPHQRQPRQLWETEWGEQFQWRLTTLLPKKARRNSSKLQVSKETQHQPLPPPSKQKVCTEETKNTPGTTEVSSCHLKTAAQIFQRISKTQI